jgi:hypothetical protein
VLQLRPEGGSCVGLVVDLHEQAIGAAVDLQQAAVGGVGDGVVGRFGQDHLGFGACRVVSESGSGGVPDAGQAIGGGR